MAVMSAVCGLQDLLCHTNLYLLAGYIPFKIAHAEHKNILEVTQSMHIMPPASYRSV